ncbi:MULTISPECIES: YifB family Mg chelatase-like AAA ATPase [Micromonospora]|uniref:ATP-binding protein n=1 Tax=Micromonospora solifontis TaxID=2487138 RepID=A0ABX9WMG9_9ACTN|nr:MULTISPECIES: YifB family Mg chelatase-like AAA ATPase [Micromonospora]NES16122.1 YifB family Mg chelatase-like AAA ATPase [Micromonospora sp. PPF5-17B]NES34890.1 YifB family Mg chelatase-like AAA ATPase [Micromonospora solifontis]NES57608.1 YifB family Mg chelatase-like AAA ATPase [Micromonospora sp. PPF5-6]RNM01457.1 ATP-binding protein [Micromonospora solifontis]
MSYAKVLCVGLVGVTGHVVEVEADLAPGLPGVVISGLPDTALHEARDRVRAAIVNSGQKWPNRRITLNLLPATLPKYGSAFDLAIAAAVLGGSGELPLLPLDRTVVLGELGLDGTVRPVRGVLPMVAAAAHAGLDRVVVPIGNAAEAAVIPGVRVRAVDTLHRLVAFVRDGTPLLPPPEAEPTPAPDGPDLAEVAGQRLGRRALEVAAAGGHHLALLGPPGAGKTMLAERLPSILPELDDEPALEVTALHSIAGLLPPGGRLLRRPPFQAPHHTATVPSLVGGGSGLARPGAVSLAHRGVLFLDEAPEFSKAALEALRQPLESGRVRVARTGGATEYPARTQLVLAANPCPCAKPSGDVDCECTPLARRRYLGRLSGPLLDRVDVQVRLLPVRAAELLETGAPSEPSGLVASRVAAARRAAAARWADTGHGVNADVPGPYLRRPPWRLPGRDTRELRRRLDSGSLSARGFDRVVRLAWTIADLDGRDRPDGGDIAEAIHLRMGEGA